MTETDILNSKHNDYKSMDSHAISIYDSDYINQNKYNHNYSKKCIKKIKLIIGCLSSIIGIITGIIAKVYLIPLLVLASINLVFVLSHYASFTGRNIIYSYINRFINGTIGFVFWIGTLYFLIPITIIGIKIDANLDNPWMYVCLSSISLVYELIAFLHIFY